MTEPEANVILTMAQRHLNAIESTSAGRLFDAVSAILGIQKSSTFEGEASMALEFTAEAWQKEHEAKVIRKIPKTPKMPRMSRMLQMLRMVSIQMLRSMNIFSCRRMQLSGR